MERSFCFRIVVGNTKIENDDDLFQISDALFDAGCDDANPEAVNGNLFISFNRESNTFEDAVVSAIASIESINGLRCTSVDCGDVVSLSDAAELANINKVTLSRYYNSLRGDGDFPSPIMRVDTPRPLWSWLDIAGWLASKGQLNIDAVERARSTKNINIALQLRHHNTGDEVSRLMKLL